MKKKIVISFMLGVLSLGMCACSNNKSDDSVTDTIVPVESLELELNDTLDDPGVSESLVNASTLEVSSEEDEKSAMKVQAIKRLESLTVDTYLMEDITMADAYIAYNATGYASEDSAMAIGILVRDEQYGFHEEVPNYESGDESINSSLSLFLRSLELVSQNGDSYESIEPVEYYNTNAKTDSTAYIMFRVPKDVVDESNLYLAMSSIYNTDDPVYLPISRDNLVNVHELALTGEQTEEEGKIYLIHDIPYFLSNSAWRGSSVSTNVDGVNIYTYEKELEFMPLSSIYNYDFSFTDTTTLEGNYDTDDYSIEVTWQRLHKNTEGVELAPMKMIVGVSFKLSENTDDLTPSKKFKDEDQANNFSIVLPNESGDLKLHILADYYQ